MVAAWERKKEGSVGDASLTPIDAHPHTCRLSEGRQNSRKNEANMQKEGSNAVADRRYESMQHLAHADISKQIRGGESRMGKRNE